MTEAEFVECFSCGWVIGPVPGPLPDDCEWACEDCAEGFGALAEPYSPPEALS